MTSKTESQALLEQLSSTPDDEKLRERTARALQGEGRAAEAIELLTSALRNLTAHEPPPVPCLCRKCLDPTRTSTEIFGMTFDRDFAVAEGRVLFYWMPRELGHRRKGAASSVQAAMTDKLKVRARHS